MAKIDKNISKNIQGIIISLYFLQKLNDLLPGLINFELLKIKLVFVSGLELHLILLIEKLRLLCVFVEIELLYGGDGLEWAFRLWI